MARKRNSRERRQASRATMRQATTIARDAAGTNGSHAHALSDDPAYRPASFLQGLQIGVREDEKDPASRIRFMSANFGEFPISHFSTFQGQWSSGAKVYREYDEAVKASLDNARYMRNDCGVMECLEARQRMVAMLNWHIEPEDEKSHEQKELCEKLTQILQRIRRFTEYRYNLQHAIWYGKYAVQHRWGWQMVNGSMRQLPTPRHKDDAGWLPINGDKLVFRHDATPDLLPEGGYPGQMGIRVGIHYSSGDLIQERWKVEATDRGMAYFLSPWERELIAVHKHTIEDAAYEDGIDAGAIHGVGIRSRIYWEWVQKQESLAFLMEYLERSAGGIELWRYPQGNATAKTEVEEAARKRVGAGHNMMLVPIPMGDTSNQYGVDVIEPGMAGIDTLHSILKDYFGHRIKRYILGQVLSSEAEATGLGSGVADLHLDTLMQIIRYDAQNLEETITFELLQQIIKFNFPAARNLNLQFRIDTESPDVEKKLEAWARAYEMGCRLKERDVMDMIGAAVPGPDDHVLARPDPAQQQGAPGGFPGQTPPPSPEAKNAAAEEMQSATSEAVSHGDDGHVPAGDEAQYAADFDTGERIPVGKYSQSFEDDHPRDEDGKFAEKNEGHQGSAPSAMKRRNRLERNNLVDRVVLHEAVDRYDDDAIEAVMTPEEISEMEAEIEEQDNNAKEYWIDDELEQFDPDDYIDVDEIYENGGGEEEIEAERERLLEEQRSDLEEAYDSQYAEFRSNYLRRFWLDNSEDPRISGGASEYGVWGIDEDGDRALAFQTSSGSKYQVWTNPKSRYAQPMFGESVLEFGFADASGGHGITGAGKAREVFTHATAAALSLIEGEQLPAMFFTAAEPSRQKLYDRLVKTIAFELPDYAAIAANVDGRRVYLVALKDKVRAALGVNQIAEKSPTVLVAPYARKSAMSPKWFVLKAERDERWFTDDSEWSDFEQEATLRERYARHSLQARINAAAQQTELNPTEAQRESGNYSKGKFRWNGLTIAIENPRGSIRSGKGWSVEMPHHYGYILRHESEADGDHVDLFMGPHPDSDVVFVVDQQTPGGRFDEHKVMAGFISERKAREAYLASYSPGWKGLRSITAMTVGQFLRWLDQGDTRRPLEGQVSRYGKDCDEPREPAGQKELEWITIGGAAEDDKKHAGGTPVQIDGQGHIHAGPAAFAGKTLDDLDKKKPKTKGGRRQAAPSDVAKAVTAATGRQFIPHRYSETADEPEELVLVDTAKLDAAWAKGNSKLYIGPEDSGIDDRRQRAADFLKSSAPVEAARIEFHPKTGHVTFRDGRHRTAEMRDAGDSEIGVMVPRSQAGEVRRLMSLGSTVIHSAQITELFDLAISAAIRTRQARYAAGFDESKHPRGQPDNAGQFAEKESGSTPSKRSAAVRGEMTAAKRVGKGKDAKIVLADGSAAPEHIKAAMIPPAWVDVQVSLDPSADVIATGRDAKGRSKTVYKAEYLDGNQAIKFARIKDGVEQRQAIIDENMANRNDPELRERADCTWLMLEQATRPGSDADTKGVAAMLGKPISAANLIVKQNSKGKASVSLSIDGHSVPIRDEGTAAQLLARSKAGQVEDSSYWLKSYGASTLEARHVVESPDGVRLQFVGKEGVWHDHQIRNPELAKMLLNRKRAADSPTGKLFNTDYKAVAKYAKTLDGGSFTPKDWRTMYATSRAIQEMERLTPSVVDEKAYKAAQLEVAKAVSSVLGNRPQQALESYIAPEVFSSWRIQAGVQ